jgi:uncharacterized 2Fe-2S/4Fe-4S cluster protein (DUF4445 family)
VDKVRITFLPQDKVTTVPAGVTVFNAAAWIGLAIDSTCGGRGTCGKCKVRLIEGANTATPEDRDTFSTAELADGWRLSCRCQVHTDTVVEVPRLMTVPKAALMGLGRHVLLAPNVNKVYLELSEPELDDQRSDLARLSDALRAEGLAIHAELDVLRTLPRTLRQAGWKVTAVVVGDDLIGVEPGDTTGESYGVAFDIGTTTVVGTLMDLRTGTAVAVDSTLNRQAIHGADVISRISFAMLNLEGLATLQQLVVETINGIIDNLVSQSGVPHDRIYEMTLAGNATMQHLVLGIDPEAISVTPFIPVTQDWMTIKARQVGIQLHPEAQLQLFPCIGAYVGGDLVAGILATGVTREPAIRLLVDVGTNGEIVLGSKMRTVATAAPAGPAFEGAQIKCGMRASAGAIEGVRIQSDGVELMVIGNVAPVGICGSGLIDAVAEMVRAGLLDASGRLVTVEQAEQRGMAPELTRRLVEVEGVRAFVLATEAETGGAPVVLTQRDVRELQFAKAAIATGIGLMMDELGITADQLEQVLLAGSFGSYINPSSARAIGLVPWVPVERILAAGNSAGEGAKIALLSFRERQAAVGIPAQVEYHELSGRVDFNDAFVNNLTFPNAH